MAEGKQGRWQEGSGACKLCGTAFIATVIPDQLFHAIYLSSKICDWCMLFFVFVLFLFFCIIVFVVEKNEMKVR